MLVRSCVSENFHPNQTHVILHLQRLEGVDCYALCIFDVVLYAIFLLQAANPQKEKSWQCGIPLICISKIEAVFYPIHY